MSWHALATYNAKPSDRVALVLGSSDAPRVYDLEAVCKAVGADEFVAEFGALGMLDVLTQIHSNADRLASIADLAQSKVADGQLSTVAGSAADLRAPLRPPRIFAAASNYVEHAQEMGTVLAQKEDSNPYVFIKASTAVIGPEQDVVIPAQTEQADWEVELAAVIGSKTRRISVEDALNCVVGYTIVNDVSARDLTRRTDYPFKFDWFQGKSFDTFAPLGPWIVPREIVGDPQALRLGLAVNDKQMQDGSTAEMIFNVQEQISYLSHMLTLEPGDVIATGTPTGVGKSRGIFLKPGDVMRATIERIGELRNPVIAEKI